MSEIEVGDRVRDRDDDEEGVVESLDNYGYIRVRFPDSGLIGGYIEGELELIDRPVPTLAAEKITPGAIKADSLDVGRISVDMVNEPPHYNSHPKGIECIEVIEDNPFLNLGNGMKYLWRVSWGGKGNDEEDLRKAIWYIQRELHRRGFDF